MYSPLLSLSSWNSASSDSLFNTLLWLNRATLIGKATVSEATHKMSSRTFDNLFLGHNPIFSNRSWPNAGKNRTGNGSTNLDIPVWSSAYLAATLDVP